MGLEKKERQYIQIDKNGCIDIALLEKGLSIKSSEGYKALYILAVDPQMITVRTSSELKVKDGKGNISDYDISSGAHEFIDGFTATPLDPSNSFLSIEPGTVEVTIDPSKSQERQTIMAAHELYIHTMLYISGMPFNHFEIVNGIRVDNKVVNDLIGLVEDEAQKNFNQK